jgi:hypothetical protein
MASKNRAAVYPKTTFQKGRVDMNADNPAAAGVKRSRALARFKWLEAVNRSTDLTPVQRAVAISIGLHFNITNGRCDPGYDAIANGTPYKRRAVITAVADLVAKGWITTEPSRGRHRNNIGLTMASNSAPIHAPLADESNSAPEERQPCMADASNSARQTAHTVEIAREKNHNRKENTKENREEKRSNPYNPQEKVDTQVVKLSQPCRSEYRDSPQPQRPGRLPSEISTIAPEDGFEEFWQGYPLKVGKGAARRAWAKAITKASPEKIIAAVRRYAVCETARMTAGDNPDFRYTAHPATWLNAERWDDEATPAVTTSKPSPQGGRSIMDLVAGSLDVTRKLQ